MKIKDIVVGEKYKVGYYGGAEVVEVRVERTTYTGKVRRDGVLVKWFEGHRDGKEEVVTSSKVELLWATHQDAVETRKRQQEVQERERERIEALSEQLKQALGQVGVPSHSVHLTYLRGDTRITTYGASVSLEESAIIALLALLGQKANDFVATDTEASEEDSHSALADLLG